MRKFHVYKRFSHSINNYMAVGNLILDVLKLLNRIIMSENLSKVKVKVLSV